MIPWQRGFLIVYINHDQASLVKHMMTEGCGSTKDGAEQTVEMEPTRCNIVHKVVAHCVYTWDGRLALIRSRASEVHICCNITPPKEVHLPRYVDTVLHGYLRRH